MFSLHPAFCPRVPAVQWHPPPPPRQWLTQRADCNHVDIGHHVTLHLISFALIGSLFFVFFFKPDNPKKLDEANTKKKGHSVTHEVVPVHVPGRLHNKLMGPVAVLQKLLPFFWVFLLFSVSPKVFTGWGLNVYFASCNVQNPRI